MKILLEEFKSDWKIRNTSYRGAFEVAGSYDDSTVPIADRSRLVRKQMRESIPELRTYRAASQGLYESCSEGFV